MRLALRAGAHYRPTRDLDLLGRGEASADAVAAAMRDILAAVVEDDGLEFDASTIEVAGIREGDRYGGLRVTVLARPSNKVVAPILAARELDRAMRALPS